MNKDGKENPQQDRTGDGVTEGFRCVFFYKFLFDAEQYDKSDDKNNDRWKPDKKVFP